MATSTPQNELEKIKIVLVGDSNVGKCGIIYTFIKNEDNENSNSTLGDSNQNKIITIGDKNVQLDISDTPSPEGRNYIVRMFHRNADIIIFVYDITNKNSFENIKKYGHRIC